MISDPRAGRIGWSRHLDFELPFGYTIGRKDGITTRNVKTAISIQKSLFEQAEKVARKMNVSRSRLFALALEDFIRREQNRELLAKINAAFADETDTTERTLRRKARGTHKRIVRGEW